MKKFKWIGLVLLLTGLGLNGCTSVLVSSPGSHTSDGRPASVVQADNHITAMVKSALIQDASVDSVNIQVSTHRGVVTLLGHTHSQAELTRAMRLARNVKGVRQVLSRLVVID